MYIDDRRYLVGNTDVRIVGVVAGIIIMKMVLRGINDLDM
jgi:hypothetical protein